MSYARSKCPPIFAEFASAYLNVRSTATYRSPHTCTLSKLRTISWLIRAELKKDITFTPGEFRELFGVKEIDGRKMYQDEESNEERVCRRVPKVIYPQMARNKDKQWVYVVNDVEYVQAVVSEVCE